MAPEYERHRARPNRVILSRRSRRKIRDTRTRQTSAPQDGEGSQNTMISFERL
jgi:hypothetical protein